MNQEKPLFEKVDRYRSQHGIASLPKEAVSYLSREVIRHYTYSAAEIQEKTDSGCIWYDDGEAPIEVSEFQNPQLRKRFANIPREFSPEHGFVTELKDCHLVGENAVALYGGTKLISETVGHRINEPFIGSFSELIKYMGQLYFERKPKEEKQCVFPLICPDPSYYHWLLEYLPKLRLLELYQSETGAKPTILIEPNPRNFVRESLECAGYGANRYEEWDGQNRAVKDLIVATHRPHLLTDYRIDYNPSLADFEWLRERMRANARQENGRATTPNRLYISRQQAGRGRKVANYPQVLEVLHRYGFEPYVLENHSFRKQVELFDQAEVIMGPHGAGLANMIFAESPTVLELVPDSKSNPLFYYLSEMMGFEYSAIITREESGNLKVDINKLEQFICKSL